MHVICTTTTAAAQVLQILLSTGCPRARLYDSAHPLDHAPAHLHHAGRLDRRAGDQDSAVPDTTVT